METALVIGFDVFMAGFNVNLSFHCQRSKPAEDSLLPPPYFGKSQKQMHSHLLPLCLRYSEGMKGIVNWMEICSTPYSDFRLQS